MNNMNFAKSTRIYQDKLEEKVLSEKLNDIYKYCCIDFKRNNDIKTQKLGCDLTFVYKDKEYVADEKNASRYYFKDLKTFCLEIQMNHNGRIYDGWFTNKNSITDVYIFNYIRAPQENNYFQDKLTSIETIIVSKRKIRDFILSYGFSSVFELVNLFILKQEENKTILHNGIESYYFNHNHFHLSKSIKFEESPINIIFSKDILIKLSSHHSIANYKNDNPNEFPDIKVHKSCFVETR